MERAFTEEKPAFIQGIAPAALLDRYRRGPYFFQFEDLRASFDLEETLYWVERRGRQAKLDLTEGYGRKFKREGSTLFRTVGDEDPDDGKGSRDKEGWHRYWKAPLKTSIVSSTKNRRDLNEGCGELTEVDPAFPHLTLDAKKREELGKGDEWIMSFTPPFEDISRPLLRHVGGVWPPELISCPVATVVAGAHWVLSEFENTEAVALPLVGSLHTIIHFRPDKQHQPDSSSSFTVGGAEKGGQDAVLFNRLLLHLDHKLTLRETDIERMMEHYCQAEEIGWDQPLPWAQPSSSDWIESHQGRVRPLRKALLGGEIDIRLVFDLPTRRSFGTSAAASVTLAALLMDEGLTERAESFRRAAQAEDMGERSLLLSQLEESFSGGPLWRVPPSFSWWGARQSVSLDAYAGEGEDRAHNLSLLAYAHIIDAFINTDAGSLWKRAYPRFKSFSSGTSVAASLTGWPTKVVLNEEGLIDLKKSRVIVNWTPPDLLGLATIKPAPERTHLSLDKSHESLERKKKNARDFERSAQDSNTAVNRLWGWLDDPERDNIRDVFHEVRHAVDKLVDESEQGESAALNHPGVRGAWAFIGDRRRGLVVFQVDAHTRLEELEARLKNLEGGEGGVVLPRLGGKSLRKGERLQPGSMFHAIPARRIKGW